MGGAPAGAYVRANEVTMTTLPPLDAFLIFGTIGFIVLMGGFLTFWVIKNMKETPST